MVRSVEPDDVIAWDVQLDIKQAGCSIDELTATLNALIATVAGASYTLKNDEEVGLVISIEYLTIEEIQLLDSRLLQNNASRWRSYNSRRANPFRNEDSFLTIDELVAQLS
jgi:hypothetical protein